MRGGPHNIPVPKSLQQLNSPQPQRPCDSPQSVCAASQGRCQPTQRLCEPSQRPCDPSQSRCEPSQRPCKAPQRLCDASQSRCYIPQRHFHTRKRRSDRPDSGHVRVESKAEALERSRVSLLQSCLQLDPLRLTPVIRALLLRLLLGPLIFPTLYGFNSLL